MGEEGGRLMTCKEVSGKGCMLKYDPLSIFKGSATPAGLYARNRWIGLDNDSRWQKDFDKTVAALSKGQLANCS